MIIKCRCGNTRKSAMWKRWTCEECLKPKTPKGYPIQCPTCCIEFNSTGDELCPDCRKGIVLLPKLHGADWYA